MLIKCALALLLLSVLGEVVGTDNVDAHEGHPEKPASQKGRLSLQNTAEIQHCLVSAGDVGCGVFECFENNSCEIRGLQEICMTFLHNAGKFDSQVSTWLHHSPTGFMSLSRVQRMTLQPARPAGIASSLACVSQGAGFRACNVVSCSKNSSTISPSRERKAADLTGLCFKHSQGKSFIKDALKCMAHGLRHKFSCISRKCLAIKEMVFQLQRECYMKHNLCSAAKDNVNVMVEMIHFQDLFPKGPYVELVNILLSCGEEVKEAITRSVRLQCEQNWGALCDSLSFCASITAAPASGGLERRPPLSSHSDGEHHKGARQGDKDKPGKVGFGSHTRSRSQGPRRASLDAGPAEQEDSKIGDIRRLAERRNNFSARCLMESRPACARAKSTASHWCFQVKNSIFLPEPLRRARSWNCSRLALDPGTGLSLHKKLRVLLTIILKWVNYCLL
ncbi:Stanniocalcin-2 [Labeo rohita]|uniref:Stanniocalcin n=2 Tax=Labeonini TaxID=2743697 RepID=A0ABQ8M1F6_LABRO|nr:Stanniocalcin-2 [Labeo rohita]